MKVSHSFIANDEFTMKGSLFGRPSKGQAVNLLNASISEGVSSGMQCSSGGDHIIEKPDGFGYRFWPDIAITTQDGLSSLFPVQFHLGFFVVILF